MAIEYPNSFLTEPSALPTQPELLVSAALHLMSHYSTRSGEAGACLKLASVIERHLKALAGHGELTPVLRATCQQLSEQWAGHVERASPKVSSVPLFDRVFRAAR
ncbi:hypothetical protein [Massilia cavernae]|uniref:Uncharacterized protein n=1 Tax=Massilia cavernae TaxID=2320864 RepID=A0A418Y6C9_9BURK|nr:hypothetical protein [Massilia cavernae]RJG23194.1 hypothetical protein D3872_04840 [Massilia cavernae]